MEKIEYVGGLKRIIRSHEGRTAIYHSVTDGRHAVSFAISRLPEILAAEGFLDGPFPLGAYIDGVPMMGMDFGYHSADPLHEDDPGTRMPVCSFLDQDWCWYDGSTMNAGIILQHWAEAGATAQWLWDYLELHHRERFGGND